MGGFKLGNLINKKKEQIESSYNGNLQKVEQEINSDRVPTPPDKPITNSSQTHSNKPTTSFSNDTFNEYEKQEMAKIFRDKYTQTKNQQNQIIIALKQEATQKLEFLNKEHERRIQEIKNDFEKRKELALEETQEQLRRAEQLMTKLGHSLVLEEQTRRTISNLELESKEAVKEKFIVEPAPITPEDKLLAADVEDFINSLGLLPKP